MKNNIKLGLCSAAAALAIATTAHAVPNQDGIRWSTDGGTTWSSTVLDTDGDGLISTTITVAGFQLTVVSSQTYPFIGSTAAPNMDLAIQGKGTVAGTSIIVEFSALDFGPIPSGSYMTHLGVTDDPNVKGSETSRIGVNPGGNALFATGVNASTIGGAALGSFDNSLSAPVAGQTAPYAITLSVTLNTTANASDTVPGSISVDAHLRTVPDGGNTLMLLGSALSVLGLGVFRKSRKA